MTLLWHERGRGMWPSGIRGALLVVAAGFAGALLGCSDGNISSTRENAPPEPRIIQPSAGYEQREGVPVEFRGHVEDDDHTFDEIEVVWSSSIDQILAEGGLDEDGFSTILVENLSPGPHTIQFQATDGEDTEQALVEIVITGNIAPSIDIESPFAAGVYYSDLPTTLRATATDAEDPPEQLRVGWEVDDGGILASDIEPDSTGLALASALFEEGVYFLVATVADTEGGTAVDDVTFEVGPPNTAPTCSITAPANLSSAPLGQLVILEGQVSDVDVPADWLSATFESNLDGFLGDVSPSTAGEVGLATAALTAATHTITMNVEDEVGGTCSDFIFLTVSTPPSATIVTPTTGAPVNVGETTTLTGVVSDAEDADDSLAVTWRSDVDGLLGTLQPNSSGEVAFNFTLTAGPHLLTLTATDSAGLTGTDTITVDVNTAPTAPTVSIAPSTPTTVDSLTVNIDVPSTDADGGPSPTTYDYAWERGATGAVLASRDRTRHRDHPRRAVGGHGDRHGWSGDVASGRCRCDRRELSAWCRDAGHQPGEPAHRLRGGVYARDGFRRRRRPRCHGHHLDRVALFDHRRWAVA